MGVLWKWAVRPGIIKERALQRLRPSRMSVFPVSWPLLVDECPCDLHFCDYLKARNVSGKSIFHFGSGGHHLVGRRNRADGLENEILAVTASPREHASYAALVTRDALLGRHYRVLFADIYDFAGASLPEFDLVTLFHLCEYTPEGARRRRMDDEAILELFRSKLRPRGRIFFYERSKAFESRRGRPGTRSLVERAVADGRLVFEERHESLLVYRAG